MLFYQSQNRLVTLIVVAMPIIAEAKSACINTPENIQVCEDAVKDQRSLKPKNSSNLDTIQLYYSGSISYNGPFLDENSKIKFSPNSEIPEDPQNVPSTNKNEPATEKSLDDLYAATSSKFRSLSKDERKNVQRCLRHGSYSGKIDGLWGKQTFEAVLNIQKNRHYNSDDTDEVNIIAKIKNAFSKKDACYELISETFSM